MNGPLRVVNPVSLQTGSQAFILLLQAVRVIRPYVWPVLPASSPYLSASGETDPQ